jgi:hypothetical protein
MGGLPIVRSLAIAFLTSAVVGQEICTTEQAPNLLVNPSWEAGTAGWSYIFPGGAASISSAYASNGQSSLSVFFLIPYILQATDSPFSSLLPTTASYSLVQQTLTNLEVGKQYTISVDLQGVVSQPYSITEQCVIYLYHDALTTTNLLANKVIQFNHNLNTGWQTFSSTYTATSATLLFGFYAYCTPFKTPVIFNAYLDNAVVRGMFTREHYSLHSFPPKNEPFILSID